MNYSEIYGAALAHHAIAISSQPRKSTHSFTGYCTDVFFNSPEELVKFQTVVEILVDHFVAVSYETDYARVRIPTVK